MLSLLYCNIIASYLKSQLCNWFFWSRIFWLFWSYRRIFMLMFMFVVVVMVMFMVMVMVMVMVMIMVMVMVMLIFYWDFFVISAEFGTGYKSSYSLFVSFCS